MQYMHVTTVGFEFLTKKYGTLNNLFLSLFRFLSFSRPFSPSLCLWDLHKCSSPVLQKRHQQPCPSGSTHPPPPNLHVRHGQSLSRQQKRHSLNLIDISCTDETIPKGLKQKHHPDEWEERKSKQEIEMLWNGKPLWGFTSRAHSFFLVNPEQELSL